jgi:hypothetical protein
MGKISQYASLTDVEDDDLLVVVDVNDTSMAASGTTKKMTIGQLPGGSGAVASVFGRTGTVTAQSGDYTAAQVGALSAASGGTISGPVSVSVNTTASGLIVANAHTTPTSPAVQIQSAASGDQAFGVINSTDTNQRFYIDSAGGLHWGSGSAVPDTGVSRSSPGRLSTGSLFLTTSLAAGKVLSVTNQASAPTSSSTQFTAAAAADNTLGIAVSGDANNRLGIDSNGKHTWGTGAAGGDTNLYRGSAGVLQTDQSFQASSGFISASRLVPTGITGATAASRYVGATTGGAPVTGTFLVGDFVIGQTGKIFICTTAGSPGTWTQAGGTVASVFGRSGVVTAQTGDYTAAQVGAVPLPAWLFDVTAYGAAGNGQVITDGAITGGQPTLTTVGLAAPSAPTLAHAGSGGTILAGTYQAEITYVNAYGETTASSSTSVTTTGSGSTITVDSPALSGNATGFYAYVTQAGGSTYTRQQAPGSPTVIGQNFILTAPPTSSGASLPGSNTTPSNPFQAGDVGKPVIVNGAGGTSVAQVLTISAFNGAGSVTLSGNAVTTVTGAACFWGTDDTTAIQAAVNAAGAYLLTHPVARVYLPQAPGGLFYMVAGAINNTGLANAQIVLPNPPVSIQQGTLEIVADTPTPLPMWTGQIPQAWGAIVSTGVFASTAAQVSNNTTYDTPAAVIGSTPASAALLTQVDSLPAFANINVIVENLTVVTPQSDQASNYNAVSLKGCAKGTFRNCTALITANYLTASGPNEFPVISHLINGLSAGFVLPGNGNNAVANAYDCTVSGYTFGAILAEQGVLQDALIVGCGWGFQLSGADPTPGEHLIRVRASVQKCYNVVWVQGTGSPSFSVDADLDMESLSNNASTFIQDSNSGAGLASLGGEIRCYGNFNLQIFPPKRPLYVKIKNKQLAGKVPGYIAAYTGFSTAGTTVPVQNPYWDDVIVEFSGSTITDVSRGVTYGGTGGSASTAPSMTSTGLAGSGSVTWHSGEWMSFAFSGSPVWNISVPA